VLGKETHRIINCQLQIPRDLSYKLKPGLRNEKTENNSLNMTELCLPSPKYFPRESFVQYCNLRSLRVKKKTSQSHQTVGKITVQSYRFVYSISSVLYT